MLLSLSLLSLLSFSLAVSLTLSSPRIALPLLILSRHQPPHLPPSLLHLPLLLELQPLRIQLFLLLRLPIIRPLTLPTPLVLSVELSGLLLSHPAKPPKLPTHLPHLAHRFLQLAVRLLQSTVGVLLAPVEGLDQGGRVHVLQELGGEAEGEEVLVGGVLVERGLAVLVKLAGLVLGKGMGSGSGSGSGS